MTLFTAKSNFLFKLIFVVVFVASIGPSKLSAAKDELPLGAPNPDIDRRLRETTQALLRTGYPVTNLGAPSAPVDSSASGESNAGGRPQLPSVGDVLQGLESIDENLTLPRLRTAGDDPILQPDTLANNQPARILEADSTSDDLPVYHHFYSRSDFNSKELAPGHSLFNSLAFRTALSNKGTEVLLLLVLEKARLGDLDCGAITAAFKYSPNVIGGLLYIYIELYKSGLLAQFKPEYYKATDFEPKWLKCLANVRDRERKRVISLQDFEKVKDLDVATLRKKYRDCGRSTIVSALRQVRQMQRLISEMQRPKNLVEVPETNMVDKAKESETAQGFSCMGACVPHMRGMQASLLETADHEGLSKQTRPHLDLSSGVRRNALARKIYTQLLSRRAPAQILIHESIQGLLEIADARGLRQAPGEPPVLDLTEESSELETRIIDAIAANDELLELYISESDVRDDMDADHAQDDLNQPGPHLVLSSEERRRAARELVSELVNGRISVTAGPEFALLQSTIEQIRVGNLEAQSFIEGIEGNDAILKSYLSSRESRGRSDSISVSNKRKQAESSEKKSEEEAKRRRVEASEEAWVDPADIDYTKVIEFMSENPKFNLVTTAEHFKVRSSRRTIFNDGLSEYIAHNLNRFTAGHNFFQSSALKRLIGMNHPKYMQDLVAKAARDNPAESCTGLAEILKIGQAAVCRYLRKHLNSLAYDPAIDGRLASIQYLQNKDLRK